MRSCFVWTFAGWGEESTHTLQASAIEENDKAQVKALISHVRWLSETICFQWWWSHANCWSGGYTLLYKHLTVRRRGCWGQWMQPSARANIVHNISQNWQSDVGLLYLHFIPFLGSWWRSWSGRRRTRLSGPWGRQSASRLLPYGEPEGSHGSSKTYLTFQVAINLYRSRTKIFNTGKKLDENTIKDVEFTKWRKELLKEKKKHLENPVEGGNK